jgi:hypothetical protein
MGNVLVQKKIEHSDNACTVTIRIKNFSESQKDFKLHEVSPVEIEESTPKPRASSFNGQFDNVWRISVKPDGEKKVKYTVKSVDSLDTTPLVEGILAEMVTGANVIPKKRVSE